jgi:hypothetical protein
MIVSLFKDSQDADELGLELVSLFGLKVEADGRYDTSWGPKTPEGLARCVERLYRERVYGLEETVAEDDRYYAANISGEDPVWPTKPVDKPSV